MIRKHRKVEVFGYALLYFFFNVEDPKVFSNFGKPG